MIRITGLNDSLCFKSQFFSKWEIMIKLNFNT